MGPSGKPKLSDLLTRLEREATSKAPDSDAIVTALEALRHSPRFGNRQRFQYHELLLRLLAFPNNAKIHRLAEQELNRVFIRAMPNQPANTGIHGSTVYATFSFEFAQWLSQRYGEAVELDWESIEYESRFDEFRELLVPHVARDSIRLGDFDIQQWCETAAGPNRTVLDWFLDKFSTIANQGEFRDHFYDQLEIPVRWELKTTSRTFQRFPPRRLSVTKPKASFDFLKQLRKPLPVEAKLNQQERNDLIDLGRSVLAVRTRETEALTHPNVDEVSLFRLEGGIDVAIYGMEAERRLPVESFFGYIAAKNGIPVAYGGGFLLFDRCDIGLNIFDTYRGLQSVEIFAAILRTYVQTFRANTVTVDSAQFGYGRPGGIRSGAFWFYYKLGFRPGDEAIAELAEAENKKRKAQPGYRCSKAVLQQLTESNVVLNLNGKRSRVPDMKNVGAGVLARVGKHFQGDLKVAETKSVAYLKSLIQPAKNGALSNNEQSSLKRLAPMMAGIEDVATWNKTDKNKLWRLMASKGGPKERDYVLQSQAHPQLKNSLCQWSERFR